MEDSAGACRSSEESLPTPHTCIDEQSRAEGHQSDGEHEHGAKRPAGRAVRLPTAGSIRPVAVFTNDVDREQNGRRER